MVFTDNFYARHRLPKHMLSYSDNEVHLIGTSKLSVMDATNLENIREAIRKLSRNNIERKQRLCTRITHTARGEDQGREI